MSKETFKRDKPHVNIGTIGHVLKKKKGVSLSIQLTLSIRRILVTMLTLTVLVTPTM